MPTVKHGVKHSIPQNHSLGMRSQEPVISIRSATSHLKLAGKLMKQGFVPVVLRAFPTNAAALAVWEGVMRWSAKNDLQF
jgi:hypothetical protein